MDAAIAAYIAGLYEGEGCIVYSPKAAGMSLRVDMTDYDVLANLRELTPEAKLYGPYTDKRHNRKPKWRWQLNGFEQCQNLIILMWPWLQTRRKQQLRAALELAHVHYRYGLGIAPREKPKKCPKGHEYANSNLSIRKNGCYDCRECGRIRDRERAPMRKILRNQRKVHLQVHNAPDAHHEAIQDQADAILARYASPAPAAPAAV